METIFALSTGPSVSGVAVIRVSGPKACDVATVFGFPLPKPRRAAVRRLYDPGNGDLLDEALVLTFEKPTSFTGEDVVELQVHGSRAIVRSVLSVLGEIAGFRPADPGEFARRAFLNGKIDLLDAEALGDLLSAETRNQAKLARLNRDRLSEACSRWRSSLLELRGLAEALIDFADEDDIVQRFDSSLEQLITELRDDIRNAATQSRSAEIVRDGFRVALLGQPNAGKSSLLNVLAKREVAITSEIAGTTRDVLEVHLDLGGQQVVLLDTAGLRESEDSLEREGIARSRKAARDADYRIWLRPSDCEQDEPPADIEIDLQLVTKVDLIDSCAKQNRVEGQLAISTRTGEGLTSLIDHLSRVAHDAAWTGLDGYGVTHERQRHLLLAADACLTEALIWTNDRFELKAEALRLASQAIDRLVGKIDPEMVLDVVFGRFCIGK